jgi:hypothetical protein
MVAVVAINVEMRGKKGRHALAQSSHPRHLESKLYCQNRNQATLSIEVLKYIPILILFEPEWDIVPTEGVKHIRISWAVVLAADLWSLHDVAEVRKVDVKRSILRQ